MLYRLLPFGEPFYFLSFSGAMDGLCSNTIKSSKLPVGRAMTKQWMSRMSMSYCLFGNTTCPLEHWEHKGAVVVAELLCSRVQTHCYVHASVISQISHKEQRQPFSSWAKFPTSYPVQFNDLHLDSKPKKQRSNNLWGICRQERGRGNFANSFLCPFLNFPLTRELIWVWALPITSKRALCSDEYFGAMGQGKSRASDFMLGLWSTFL